MTTLELIEQAREYAEEYGHDSEGGITIPFPRDKLLELADKLEMAYEDLQLAPVCANCKFFEGAATNDKSWVCEQCIINNQYRVPTNWQWRGDTERKTYFI